MTATTKDKLGSAVNGLEIWGHAQLVKRNSGGWWFKCISRIFNAGYFLYNIYCSVQLMQNTARVTVGGFGSHRNLESLAITV